MSNVMTIGEMKYRAYPACHEREGCSYIERDDVPTTPETILRDRAYSLQIAGYLDATDLYAVEQAGLSALRRGSSLQDALAFMDLETILVSSES